MKQESVSGTREMGLFLWPSLDHHLLSTASIAGSQLESRFPVYKPHRSPAVT